MRLPDFVDKTGSTESTLYLNTSVDGHQHQQRCCSLETLNLFPISFGSLCNAATRFVCWEGKEVRKRQVESP